MGANMSPGEPACPLIHPVQKTGTTSTYAVSLLAHGLGAARPAQLLPREAEVSGR